LAILDKVVANNEYISSQSMSIDINIIVSEKVGQVLFWV